MLVGEVGERMACAGYFNTCFFFLYLLLQHNAVSFVASAIATRVIYSAQTHSACTLRFFSFFLPLCRCDQTRFIPASIHPLIIVTICMILWPLVDPIVRRVCTRYAPHIGCLLIRVKRWRPTAFSSSPQCVMIAQLLLYQAYLQCIQSIN